MRSDRDSGIWRALILSWATVIVIGFFVWTDVRAQAGVAVSAVGRSTVGLVQRQWGRMGFAANDPRYLTATSTYGSAVGGAATNVLVVAGGALILGTPIGWGTLAVAALVGAGTSIALDLLTSEQGGQVTLNPDGTYSYSRAGQPLPASTLLSASQCFTDSAYPAICVSRPEYVAPRLQSITAASANGCLSGFTCGTTWEYAAPGTSGVSCGSQTATRGCTVRWDVQNSDGLRVATFQRAISIQSGTRSDPPPPPQTVTGATAAQALADLPASTLDAALNPAAEAALANRLWAGASANDDRVIPYSPANAITPQDVLDYRAANPGAAPTLRQFLSDPALTLGQSLPQPQPSTQPALPVAGAGTPIDLGFDPQIGPPELEDTPEAGDILSPILNLGGDLRNMVITPQPSACPVAAFDAFNRSYSIDAHCSLIEPFRPLIQGAMMLVWLLVAAYAVLRA